MTRRSVLLLSAAALAVGACGDDGDPTAAGKPDTTAAPSKAYGVYTREVAKADIERTMKMRHHPPGFEPPPAGRYQMTLARGKGFDVVKITDPNGFVIAMDSKLDGDELRFVAYAAPEVGVFCDASISAQARYALTPSDEAVKLAPTQDECADRDSVLTGTWRRS